jgi:hypothetical protein
LSLSNNSSTPEFLTGTSTTNIARPDIDYYWKNIYNTQTIKLNYDIINNDNNDSIINYFLNIDTGDGSFIWDDTGENLILKYKIEYVEDRDKAILSIHIRNKKELIDNGIFYFRCNIRYTVTGIDIVSEYDE